MTYSEVLQAARGCSGPYCKACPVCNGRACGSSMPGPGAKGTGTVAVRNYEAWQSIRLDLDTICENKPVDTRYTFFGQQYDLPVFAGPVGATKLHYGEKYDDQAYNSILVPACAQAGIAAFTGDGTDPAVFTAAARAIGASGGKGIPTVKPWDRNTLFSKLDEAKAIGPDGVTEGSYEKLQNAIQEAEGVYNDPNASQDAVNQQILFVILHMAFYTFIIGVPGTYGC